jgi:hypothetical protein
MLVVLTIVALFVTLIVPFGMQPTAAHVPSGLIDCACHSGQTVIADCAPSISIQTSPGLHCASTLLVFFSGIVSLQLSPRVRSREADARLYPLEARPELFQRPPPSLSAKI